VGSGLTESVIADLLERFQDLVRPDPVIPELAGAKGAVFVEPRVVCEVEYLEITKGSGKMRAPVFKRLRDDKLPEDCVLEPVVSATRR
jgi:ATP-dependent DNA ligase